MTDLYIGKEFNILKAYVVFIRLFTKPYSPSRGFCSIALSAASYFAFCFSIKRNSKIISREWMTIFTMRLPKVFSANIKASLFKNIISGCNLSDVLRIAAFSISTNMITNKFLVVMRGELNHKLMGSNLFSPVARLPVAISIKGTSPFPASIFGYGKLAYYFNKIKYIISVFHGATISTIDKMSMVTYSEREL